MGVNKVTGLIKMKKGLQMESVPRQSNILKEDDAPVNGKGKSLGSKKVTIREKYGAFTDKNGGKPLLKSRHIEVAKPTHHLEDDYYEEKWEDEDDTHGEERRN
ncbi:unnamed protein product [Sphagnum balticum]